MRQRFFCSDKAQGFLSLSVNEKFSFHSDLNFGFLRQAVKKQETENSFFGPRLLTLLYYQLARESHCPRFETQLTGLHA
jgi:hypothetical protein